jgi:hypothetical protein
MVEIGQGPAHAYHSLQSVLRSRPRGDRFGFHIQATNLDEQLLEFGRETGAFPYWGSVGRQPHAVRGHAVTGTFEIADALKKMMAGTGWTFELEDDSWIYIRPIDRVGIPISVHLPAGDAALTLNEFCRQTLPSLLFDYSQVEGHATRAVSGELRPDEVLAGMLRGSGLKYSIVNDHTFAVSLADPPWWRKWARPQPTSEPAPPLPEVMVSAQANRIVGTSLGAPVINLTREDIDKSGVSTVQDLLRTLPQIVGSGPTGHTVLGFEARSNTSRGTSVNIRGMDAGEALVLIDG